jgi:KUP system potassium uptake protein
MSTRKKINTKSSTEAELVGVADAMSQIAWVRNFLIAQGFEITDNVIYQDNQSTILLARNGRRSSGKRTRHIDIRYFFVTDRIAQGDVRVEYCPTQQMVADIFTKPLQGSLFRRLRDLVLNVPAPTPDSTNIAESQERVENTDNGWQEGIHRTDIGSQNDYNDKGGRAAAVKSDNKSDTQYGRSDDNCLASAANADPSDSGWTMVKRPTKASTRQKK